LRTAGDFFFLSFDPDAVFIAIGRELRRKPHPILNHSSPRPIPGRAAPRMNPIPYVSITCYGVPAINCIEFQ
jgi:hypothetical protein